MTDSPQLMVTATTRPWPCVSQSIPRVGLGITVFWILALPGVTLRITAKEVNIQFVNVQNVDLFASEGSVLGEL